LRALAVGASGDAVLGSGALREPLVAVALAVVALRVALLAVALAVAALRPPFAARGALTGLAVGTTAPRAGLGACAPAPAALRDAAFAKAARRCESARAVTLPSASCASMVAKLARLADPS
jgi:hypothetical protein